MASIGTYKATFQTQNSIASASKQVSKSVSRISSNSSRETNGNTASYQAMRDRFQMDVASKAGAVRSLSVAKGYLGATISVLDSASDMLAKLQELAVFAANGMNTDADNKAINTESERLADRFHTLMSTASYKGIDIFRKNNGSGSAGAAANGSNLSFGVGAIDYDNLYDYTNPGLNVTQPGVKYEVKNPLTEAEKDAILAQTTGITRDQLVVGFQFTTTPAEENIGPGISTDDLYYMDGDGSVPFDAASTVVSDEIFNGGSLNVQFTDNGEGSDHFNLTNGDGTAGSIVVNGSVVSYRDANHGYIEIGEVVGQNTGTLQINFFEDASIPGTSNLLNGDFSNGSANWNLYNQRVDFGSSFTVNGITIPTPTDAEMVRPIHGNPPNNDNANSNRNSGTLSTAGGALNLDTGGMTIDSFGIYHGPAAVSDAFVASKGDFLKFDFSANGAGDDYHVAGYLVNTADNSITIAINDVDLINPPELNSTGKRIDGSTSVEVPDDGTYHFVFITGTYDKTGGTVAGASMTIDNIRAENPFDITDDVVQSVLRGINYSSSSNDQASVKDVRVTAATDGNVVSLVDDSKIFNTEFNGNIMIAPTRDLENEVSTGGSNNLGNNGQTKTSIVVEDVEIVQQRVNQARAIASSQFLTFENALDASTDLKYLFMQSNQGLGSINFSQETVQLTKQQMMEDVATAMHAQANLNQSGLLVLVEKLYLLDSSRLV